MNYQNFSSFIEHTLLKPTAVAAQIEQLCEEAHRHNFFGVCISGCWVSYAASLLKNTPVKIISVFSFPLGSNSTAAKIKEMDQLFHDGAHEADFVLNMGWLKERNLAALAKEFELLVKNAQGFPLKVILETCYLTDEEKKIACQLAVQSGIAFVKTSTGFGSHGAVVEDILLMKSAVNNNALIKASGGIRDAAAAAAMIKAGASRIGTSSGISMVNTCDPMK